MLYVSQIKCDILSAYIRAIVDTEIFRNTIYFASFVDTKEYIDLTVLTIAEAITMYAHDVPADKVTVVVDGLKRQEIHRFAKGLRQLRYSSLLRKFSSYITSIQLFREKLRK